MYTYWHRDTERESDKKESHKKRFYFCKFMIVVGFDGRKIVIMGSLDVLFCYLCFVLLFLYHRVKFSFISLVFDGSVFFLVE